MPPPSLAKSLAINDVFDFYEEDGGGSSAGSSTLEGDKWHTSLACKYFSRNSLSDRNLDEENLHKPHIARWLLSFRDADPRWQIMKYFDGVATKGRGSFNSSKDIHQQTLFRKKANLFTVWRPTSEESIKNMMLGLGTGKGIDIKGKSAKRGNISSFVPFVQIYEDEHKKQVQKTLKDDEIVRVFFRNKESRDKAMETLSDVRVDMLLGAADAAKTLAKFNHGIYVAEEEQEFARARITYNNRNLRLEMVDTYASAELYGVDISEMLFWEAFVMIQDCSRPKNTDWDIGRGSSLHLMNGNFSSTRHVDESIGRRVVVYQKSENPMEPRQLLVAYEENESVLPVVSDFDLFLLGSRGLEYREIGEDQLELLQWLLRNIHGLFQRQKPSDKCVNLFDSWPNVIRNSRLLDKYYPETPQYGHCDPVSYDVIRCAAERLKDNGCVRHGPECFNFHYPQAIDDYFLVICEVLPHTVSWKKMKPDELQELLIEMIDDGFTFPLNPKWILCDPGWKRVYDKLLKSNSPAVQSSLNCWFPPESGIREKIDQIWNEHSRYLLGLNGETDTNDCVLSQNKKQRSSRLTLTNEEVGEALFQKVKSQVQTELSHTRKAVSSLDEMIRYSISHNKHWRLKRWMSSLRLSDPRWQILKAFDEAAAKQNQGRELSEKPGVFTVWRDPPPAEAMKNMMLGVASGKGLNIKTPSATRGNINAFVPFIICDDKDKEKVWDFLEDDQVFRVFYPNEDSRTEALVNLRFVKEIMFLDVQMRNDQYCEESDWENSFLGNRFGNRFFDDTDLQLTLVDDCAPNVYGLDISERLMWEAYAMQRDCSRPKESVWDVGGVKSLMTYMKYNIDALRNDDMDGYEGYEDSKVAIYQTNASDPMEPRTLVMSYEEPQDRTARPVVRDFACLLFGTTGVKHENKIPTKQLEWRQWCLKNIENILGQNNATIENTCWGAAWLGILDANMEVLEKFGRIPKYGFGDPTSYSIFENAVKRLQATGCVRNGAECFNWYFPQRLDERFLVISDTIPGKWKIVNLEELQDLLCAKIDEGYAFPIHTKWILCDSGWKKVYDKLIASDNPNIQVAANCWFPPETGIRDEIDRIYREQTQEFFSECRGWKYLEYQAWGWR